jgi:hypothetical protein
VSASPVKEIGWIRVRVEDTLARAQLVRRDLARLHHLPVARRDLRDSRRRERILRGTHCRNQAYVSATATSACNATWR